MSVLDQVLYPPFRHEVEVAGLRRYEDPVLIDAPDIDLILGKVDRDSVIIGRARCRVAVEKLHETAEIIPERRAPERY